MVTGPVTRNMREALERTYHATPDPKWVVAVGDCALDGGIFAGSYAVVGGVAAVVPVDLHIRGCPPRPEQLLRGLLALLDGRDCVARMEWNPRSPDERSDMPRFLSDTTQGCPHVAAHAALRYARPYTPRYAACTRSSARSSAALPLAVMRPVSTT